jgi:hypothetical protein
LKYKLTPRVRRPFSIGYPQELVIPRHLFGEDHVGQSYQLQNALNEHLGKNSYVYAGVDYLAEVVQQALKGNGKGRA